MSGRMGRGRFGAALVLAAGIAVGFVGGVSVAPDRIAAQAAGDPAAALKRLEAQVAAHTAEIRKINQQLGKVGVQTRALTNATRRIATRSGIVIELQD